MSLEEMLLRDELRREDATAGEVARLLTAIGRRLEDAGNEANHPETRLEQAYHAILNCALVGLRANGLRPTDRRGHHIVALESLVDTLGIPHDRVDYFQTLRDLRNKDLYTGGGHVTFRQAEEAIAEATALQSELERWLGKRDAGNH
ncbi:hypothetical protein KJ567_03180 [Candidatus Bipolaricaulota bacterium]|nr:hypothetical protein [Candidatus Bipolaricaulota bacterium]